MKKYSLALVALVMTLFISGCSSKNDVGFDATSGGESTPASTVASGNVSSTSSAVDGKLSYINVVESEVNGKTVALKSVHFAFDKFNLSDDMRVITKENYKTISKVVADNSNLKVKIEGNCDEWGTDEYNYALGLKRAKTVKDALVSDGIDSSKIVLVSFGESNPICNEKTEKCWKQNRRADYRLLP